MASLGAPVGFGGQNRRDDVIAVQQRLQAHGLAFGAIDGVCGRRTIEAIKAFQRSFLPVPDGRVDVSSLTWRKLAETRGDPAPMRAWRFSAWFRRHGAARCRLALGAVETGTGFIAGRFQAGRAVASDDPQSRIEAFRAAQRGAERASELFRSHGNAASAAFYAEAARRLGNQIE